VSSAHWGTLTDTVSALSFFISLHLFLSVNIYFFRCTIGIHGHVCVSLDWADIAFHYLLDSEGYVYEARFPFAFPAAISGYAYALCYETEVYYCLMKL